MLSEECVEVEGELAGRTVEGRLKMFTEYDGGSPAILTVIALSKLDV